VEDIVLFSKTVMPTITPRELFTNPKYDNLHPGFKKIVKHLSVSPRPVELETILVMACRIVIQKYDKDLAEGIK